ncbi:YceI family protein [Lutibacter sp. TH_r2]|uniref:YceI family protein n=1 Tax=Lutibacter sp. TH_r2 TaxID=3082083 RepID=UPI0029545F0E|nr:YceI family protein [Lutibacter sp. TH_r2]MDV7187769.1 YceI family protein [Lutibacter sp. TH_r2]
MKKLVVLALLVSVAFIACKTEKKETKPEVAEAKTEVAVIEDGVYTAKVEASTLNWKGYKPTGSHDGTVAIKEGNLTVKEGKLIAGTFTFDMSAITVLDIPADDEMNAKLVKHLKNEDFFDVENNPTSTFEITSVEGETVKGNLTVKGISKPIEFKAVVNEVEGGIELVGETFKIDRTEYNIEYKSKKFFDNLKDKFINDEFEISFKVEASK